MESNILAFYHQRQLVTSIIHTAKLEYLTKQITCASGDQRQLFKIVAKLLHSDNDTPLPPCESFYTLATSFSDFFCEKISIIRSGRQPCRWNGCFGNQYSATVRVFRVLLPRMPFSGGNLVSRLTQELTYQSSRGRLTIP